MKPKKPVYVRACRASFLFATAIASLLIAGNSARAAQFYWDDGTVVVNGASEGGTGAWTVGAAGWENGASAQNWANGNDAVFSGTAGTVTLGGPISANSLTFGTTGYLVTGNTLTLGGAPRSMTVTGAGDSATVASIITGTGGMVKDGAGTLILTGVNTVTGGTTAYAVNAGTLQAGTIATTTATLAGGATVSVASGANLVLASASNAGLDMSGVVSGAGAVTYLGNNGAATTGVSALAVNNANTYSGGTTFTSARANVSNAAGFGTGAVTINDGGQVYIATAMTMTNNFTLNGLGWHETSTTRNGAIRVDAAVTLSGAITLASDAGIGAGNTATLTGAISGNAALAVNPGTNNTGTVVLSGNNTYTNGTTLSRGTLRILNSSTALGGGPFTFAGTSTLATATGSSAITLANDININATFTGTVDTGFADITLNGVIGGAGNLTKNATGTLTFNGANTGLSGTVSLNAGVTLVGNNAALGTGKIDFRGSEIRSTDATARQFTNAISFSANTVFGSAATGDLAFYGDVDAGSGAKTFTVSNARTEFAGVISNPAPTTNAFTKNGAGELVLSGANTFSNPFLHTAGILTLDYTNGDTSKLADGSALTLGAGTLKLHGGMHLEGVASTTISGTAKVVRDSGSSMINLNAITRNAGASIDFQYEGLALTDTLNNTNGILGSWATINGSDWAVNLTNAEDGPIGAYTTYEGVVRQGGQIVGSFEGSPATHVKIQDNDGTGNVTLFSTGTTDIATLINASTGGPATVDLGTNTLRLAASGAILNSAAAGALSFTGGTLTAGGVVNTAGEILVNNANATNPVTIQSTIANNGTGAVTLVKAGPGALVLAGANTHTGATTVTAGSLVLANELALQNSILSPLTNGVFFDSSVGSHAFSIAGLAGSGGLVLQDNAVAPNPVTLSVGTNNTNSSYGGVISGPGTLIKKGTGSFSLTSTNAIGLANTTIDVQGGTFRLDNSGSSAALTPNAGVIVKANAGTTVSLVQTQARAYESAKTWSLGSQVTLNGATLTGGATTGAQFQRLTAATAIQVDAASIISQSSGSYGQMFAIEGAVSGTGNLTINRAGPATSSARYVNLKGSFAGYSGDVTVGASTSAGYVLFGHSTGWGSGDLTLASTGTTTITGASVVIGDEVATAINSPWTGGSALAFTAGTLAPAGDITVNQNALLRLYNNTAGSAILLEPHGAVTVNGGTLGALGTAGTSAYVPFTGSTWAFGGTALSTVSGNVALNNSGATFQVADAVTTGEGTDANISGVISGANGFTKTGPGRLSLTGANTYTGATTVSEGTLFVTSTPASAVSVANGATLAVNGTVGPVNISPGGTISPSGPPAATNALIRTVTSGTTSTVTTTGDFQELHNNAGTIIPNNTTYTYSGQIYLPGATGAIYYFGENFDDSIVLKINGATVLASNAYNVIGTGSFTSPGPGWYSFSLEAANGTGGTGPVAATGWGPGKGVGFATTAPTTATDGSFYSAFTLDNLTTAGIQLRSASGVAECVAGATIGGIYRCDVSEVNSDKLAVTGDLNLSGATLTVNPVGGGATLNTYVIATYTGTLTGTFASVQAPAGYAVNYNTAAKQVELVKSTATGFAAWIAGFPGLSDATAGGDPDHDGIKNLLEYVLDGNPSVSGTSILPVQTMDATNVTFTFKRRDDSETDTTQIVQWSTNLTNWTDIAIGAGNSSGVTIAENGASPDDVTVTIPRSNASPDGKLFVRLRVTQP